MQLSDICSNKQGMKFLKRASQLNVQFIVIGGAALCFHGKRDVGTVKDLDIYIKPDMENIEKLLHVFQFFNINLVSDPVQMAQDDMRMAIKNVELDLDILSPKPEDSFEEFYQNSHMIDTDLPNIRILSVKDMIKIKERTVRDVAARLKVHQKDLEELNSQ